MLLAIVADESVHLTELVSRHKDLVVIERPNAYPRRTERGIARRGQDRLGQSDTRVRSRRHAMTLIPVRSAAGPTIFAAMFIPRWRICDATVGRGPGFWSNIRWRGRWIGTSDGYRDRFGQAVCYCPARALPSQKRAGRQL